MSSGNSAVKEISIKAKNQGLPVEMLADPILAQISFVLIDFLTLVLLSTIYKHTKF